MKEFDFKDLQNKLIDNVSLQRLGNKALAIIRKRTREGEFKEGDKNYSTTPLPLPFGKFTAVTRKQLSKGEREGGEYKIFTAKSGNVWIVVKGGYKRFRELAGKDSSNVSMNWSGRMMRNLGVLKQDADSVEIGFKSEEEKQKAIWHNIMGAGKSKKKHIFMYLNDAEQKELAALAEKLIIQNLKSL